MGRRTDRLTKRHVESLSSRLKSLSVLTENIFVMYNESFDFFPFDFEFHVTDAMIRSYTAAAESHSKV